MNTDELYLYDVSGVWPWCCATYRFVKNNVNVLLTGDRKQYSNDIYAHTKIEWRKALHLRILQTS